MGGEREKREGVRYLNAGAGQHRRSSELPESEGRTGRGGRRTEVYSFCHNQAHILIAHTDTLRQTLTHTLLDFRLIFGLQKLSSGTLPVPS